MTTIFSVIMPVYNAASTIRASIESVLNQTCNDFELIICDDNSTDNSLDIIKSYSDERIIVLRNKFEKGASGARNTCIEFAKGKYISFLDSDDIWSVRKLERQLKVLESGYVVVCSNYVKFKGDVGNVISFEKRKEHFSLFDMLMRCQIGNLTGVYNQEAVGKFYQCSQGHEDYIMWLDILSKVGHGYCIQEDLAFYRVSSVSLSGNKMRAARWQWDIYRSNLRFGLLKSLFFWFQYAVRSVLKIS